MIDIERIRKNARAISVDFSDLKLRVAPHRERNSSPDSFQLWDIVSRDGTDQQLIYDITPQQLHMVCVKPSGLDYMQEDNWVIGETESNVPWRYNLVYKCLTPKKLLKQIGRSDLWQVHK